MIRSISVDILSWLLRYPLQRDADLAVACQVHPTTIFRHLTQLARAGLVESLAPSTRETSRRLYYLTQAGLEVVAARQGLPPRQLARSWGADERSLLALLPRLPVLLLVQNVLNGLIVQAPTMLAYPNGQRANLSWHWRRDWQQEFLAKGRVRRYRAEAALVLYRHPFPGKGSGDYYPLFLLADAGFTGATDRRIIEQRLERLFRYRESAERIAHYQQFPPVIVLVPDLQQQERWQRAASEVASALRIDPLRGAITRVCLQEKLPSAWTLPWQRLEGQAPCRLQDVLVPTSLEALPKMLLLPAHAQAEPTARERKRNVIRGHFAERAVQAAKEQNTTQSGLALRSLSLSERQMGLLHLLYTAPLLSTAELAALYALEPPTAARALYDLREAGWIEWKPSPDGRRWHLGGLGLRLLAARLQVPLPHIAMYSGTERQLVQRGLPLLLRHLRHTAGVYGFLACLHVEAARAGHQVRLWEVGAWCERRYHDHGSWHNLRPDAAFEYVVGTKVCRAWVEWDMGTMPGASLAHKMQAYAHYVRSRKWAHIVRALPTLLVIAPGPGQEQRVRQVAQVCVEAGLEVRITTATRLSERGPGGAIWLDPARTTAAGARYTWFSSSGSG